jgi:hypothetical protein
MQRLAVGESKLFELRDEAPTWVLLEIVKEGKYVLEAKSPDKKDTSIALYQSTDNKEIGYDDDGGGGVDPRLEQELGPGKYYLALEELFGLGSRPSQIQVTVRSATGKGS